jgi:hypothetical protein
MRRDRDGVAATRRGVLELPTMTPQPTAPEPLDRPHPESVVLGCCQSTARSLRIHLRPRDVDRPRHPSMGPQTHGSTHRVDTTHARPTRNRAGLKWASRSTRPGRRKHRSGARRAARVRPQAERRESHARERSAASTPDRLPDPGRSSGWGLSPTNTDSRGRAFGLRGRQGTPGSRFAPDTFLMYGVPRPERTYGFGW